MLYNLFILFPILGIITFSLLWQNRKLDKLKRPEMKEMNSKYKLWDSEIMLCWIIFAMPLFTYLVCGVILGFICDKIFPDNKYFLRDGFVAIPPTVIFGLIITPAILRLYRMKMGKEEYAKYIPYQVQRDRFPMRSYAIILPLYLNFMILSLDSYTRITDREIIINPYFGFTEKIYSFNDIQNISNKTYSNRNGYNIGYVIEFNNGEKFEFYRSTHRINIDKQEEVVNYIKKKIDLK